MSEAIDVANPEPVPSSTGLVSLGDLRKARQLSINDIAQKTRLSAKQIDLLESARFSELPGTAFTMGAIRSYCKVLGVAAEPYLEQVRSAYDAAQRGELLQSPDQMSKSLPRRHSGGFEGSSSKGWWIASAILALCAIAVFVIQPAALTSLVKRASAPTQTAPVTTPGSTASTTAPATTSEVIAPNSGLPTTNLPPATGTEVTVGASQIGTPMPTIVVPASGSSGSSSDSAAGSTAAPSAPASISSLPATQDIAASLPKSVSQAKIEIATVRDAWVEIRDASGAVVVNRLFRAGSKESVNLNSSTGAIVVGSATGVTLNWNGTPVDLKPYIKDDVARMNLK